MDPHNPVGKFLGLSRNELAIFLYLGGALVCVIMLFAGYILYSSALAVPAATRTPFPALGPSATRAPYRPAPSITGWVSGTPATATVTPTPTKTRRPTSTPVPSSTPTVTNTPTATMTLTPTPTVQLGIASNPVPIGSGFTIPDMGTLTVVRSSWATGQTGLAIVELSFVCGRPIGELCKTSSLILDALGGSGTGYDRAFDSAIPEPGFGYGPKDPLYGGGTETGNAGFLVENKESSLMMIVQVFLQEGKFFFWIGPVPPG